MAGVSENTIDQSTDVASTPPESTRLPEKEENIVGLEQTSDHASKENREYASIENGIRGDVEQQQQVTIVQDEAPFSIWNSSQKKMIILVASAAAFFSPVSGQIYFPALNIIAEDLNVTDTMVNLSITTYMVSLPEYAVGKKKHELRETDHARPRPCLCRRTLRQHRKTSSLPLMRNNLLRCEHRSRCSKQLSSTDDSPLSAKCRQ